MRHPTSPSHICRRHHVPPWRPQALGRCGARRCRVQSSCGGSLYAPCARFHSRHRTRRHRRRMNRRRRSLARCSCGRSPGSRRVIRTRRHRSPSGTRTCHARGISRGQSIHEGRFVTERARNWRHHILHRICSAPHRTSRGPRSCWGRQPQHHCRPGQCSHGRTHMLGEQGRRWSCSGRAQSNGQGTWRKSDPRNPKPGGGAGTRGATLPWVALSASLFVGGYAARRTWAAPPPQSLRPCVFLQKCCGARLGRL